MSPAVRTALTLTGCLVLLAAAGWAATTAMRSATVASTQVATAPVVVDANDDAGIARLTVLAPMTFDSGGGRRQVAAGTQFGTASTLLTGSLPAPATVATGDTLSCAMRVSISRGQPVIDLVRCEPGRTSPRG